MNIVIDSLPTKALSATRTAEWRPGLNDAVSHGEVFAPSCEASGAAVALAFALDRMRHPAGDALPETLDQRPWLWVQDAGAQRLTGRPYRPGLPSSLRHRLVHVAARTPEDALFALEEGLRCRDLAFVIGEIAGNPKALGLTASRRLGLAVERHGIPLWLVRLDAQHDLGSARLRWDVRTRSSPRPPWNTEAPGIATWHAELFRARQHPPGEWILRDDGSSLTAAPPVIDPSVTAPSAIVGTPDIVDLAHSPGDRPLATG
jgi:protein ImuA